MVERFRYFNGMFEVTYIGVSRDPYWTVWAIRQHTHKYDMLLPEPFNFPILHLKTDSQFSMQEVYIDELDTTVLTHTSEMVFSIDQPMSSLLYQNFLSKARGGLFNRYMINNILLQRISNDVNENPDTKPSVINGILVFDEELLFENPPEQNNLIFKLVIYQLLTPDTIMT